MTFGGKKSNDYSKRVMVGKSDGVCPHNVDISWKYTWKQLTIFIECWNLNKMHNYNVLA